MMKGWMIGTTRLNAKGTKKWEERKKEGENKFNGAN